MKTYQIRTDVELTKGSILVVDSVNGNSANATVIRIGGKSVRIGPKFKEKKDKGKD